MEKQIENIISDKISGNQLDKESIELLDNWLKIANNRTIYAELEKVWDITGQVNFSMSVDVDKEWAYFKVNRTPVKTTRFSSFAVISIAASIILAIGLFVGLQNQSIIYQYSDNQNHYILPDSSEIWLNKDASVKVTNKFGKKERIVSLNGEAFFEVQKGKMPFVVTTQEDVSVRVLGTSFNVNGTVKNKVQLQVVTGVVEFGNAKKNIAELVKKGNEAIIFTDQNKIVTSTIDHNKISWHTGDFSFNNESIDHVVEMLESYLLIDITLPPSFKNARYSGDFNQPSAEDVAEILAQALGLNYDLNKKSLTFLLK